MSHRELRSCVEMLRALGFPRLISLENFRNPNFFLVAEILSWLVKRFDPSADLPTEVDAEQDRIIFIRSVAQFMATKANVRLNTKKLYQADGYAVQEILKALVLLYGALNSNGAHFNDEGAPTLTFDVSNKVSELKQIRGLASEITSRGALLYDLLRREVDLREQRTAVLSRQLELSEVEDGMKNAIESTENQIAEFQSAIQNVNSDEANLDGKIEKKKTGLERGQKRFQTLRKVRPAFMDEYERLEAELKRQYDVFIQRFMSLAFLEQKLEDYDKAEQDKMTEKQTTTRRMIEKMTFESGLSSIGDDSTEDDLDDSDEDEDDDDDEAHLGGASKEKPKSDSLKDAKKADRQLFGTMTGGEPDTESLDSDSELNMTANGGFELDPAHNDSIDADSLGLSVPGGSGSKSRGKGKAPSSNPIMNNDDFDDDF